MMRNPRFFHWLLPTVLFSVLVAATGGQILASSDVPELDSEYSILIEYPEGGGASGFFFKGSQFLYLVTARHVLFDPTSNRPIADSVMVVARSSGAADTDVGRLGLRLRVLDSLGCILSHSQHDVVVVRVAAVSGQVAHFDTPGVSRPAGPIADIKALVPENVKLFDSVLIGNEVYMYGYPHSLGLRNMPQIDYSMPLLRKGIVAGKNHKLGTIIIDCPIYYGNSGALVRSREQISTTKVVFKAVGIVIQFIPFIEEWVNRTHGYSNTEVSNSGYAVIEPMDVVLSLIPDISAPDKE